MQERDNNGLIYSWGSGNGNRNFKLFCKQKGKCVWKKDVGSEGVQNH